MPLKVKKNSVEQTIDLKEKFGVDFRGKDNLKQLIGQAIIDRIVERSKNGEGVSIKEGTDQGRSVKLKSPYSKTYADSLEFKAAGKQKNDVNMTLTGQMLGSIDIKRIEGNKITIGWNDTEENNKAYNHIVGDTVPKRPFFGVTNKELRDLKSSFKEDIDRAIKVKQSEGTEAFNKLVLGLLDELGDGNEG